MPTIELKIQASLGLKDACSVSLIATLLSLIGSSLHLHLIWLETSLYKKFKSFSIHHLSSLFGLGSLSLSRHQIHISVPIHRLLLSGIDPMSMPCLQELLNLCKSSLCFHNSSSLLGSSGKLLTNASVLLGQVITHHHAFQAVLFLIVYVPTYISRYLQSSLQSILPLDLSFVGA